MPHQYSVNRRGKHVETVTSLMFFGSKITKNSDCSHQIKCHLLCDVKEMRNLDIALKKNTHHLKKFSVSKKYNL